MNLEQEPPPVIRGEHVSKEKTGMLRKAITIGLIVVIAYVIGKFIGRNVAREEQGSGASITKSSPPQLDLQQGASTLADLNIYQDDKFPFTVNYPKGWLKVNPVNPATRINLVNVNPEGNSEGFNVVASHIPALKSKSPEEYIAYINRNPNAVVDVLKSSMDDIKVIQRGETKLSGQAAYFLIVDGRPKSVGTDEISRVLQIMTIREGDSYHLTFTSEPAKFDSALPVFKQIASSFSINSL